MIEWNEAKNRSNFIKHGLDFEDAEKVFAGPCVTFMERSGLSPWVCSPGASS